MKAPSLSLISAFGLLCSALNAGQAVPLFDGKTFKGWDGDTNKTWRIEDGMIIGGDGKTKVPQNEFIATTRNYTNYVLRLKFKLTGTDGFVNSGVQYHSQRIPNHNEMKGYQADLGEGWFGAIYDESRRNKVMARPEEADVKKAVKLNEWNDYEVQTQGRRTILKINGVQMVDYTEADESIPQFGRIGLQIHGGGTTEVRFKNVKIEELP
jgi:hypothetical protein